MNKKKPELSSPTAYHGGKAGGGMTGSDGQREH